jgi:hypothetical protein
MKARTAAGPTVDTAFFEALDEVFTKHPEAKLRYAISSTALETNVLRVDFDRQRAVARIEGNQIITEFPDHDDGEGPPHSIACCTWGWVRGEWKCVKHCPT